MTTFYLDHSWRQQAKSDRYYYNFLPARPWGLGQYLTEKRGCCRPGSSRQFGWFPDAAPNPVSLTTTRTKTTWDHLGCCPIEFHTAFTASSWRYFESLLSFLQIFLLLSQILLLLLTAIFHQTHTHINSCSAPSIPSHQTIVLTPVPTT